MTFLTQNKLKAERIRQRGMAESYQETPDFTETMGLTFTQMRATDLFTSEANMRERFQEPEQDKLRAMRDSGQISEGVWQSFVEEGERHSINLPATDWKGLANYANDKYGLDIDLSDESMYAVVRQESMDRESLLSKASPVNRVAGGFIGAMGAIATDPVQAPAMLIPGTQMKFGATALRTVAKMAFREGMFNVAIEAPLQLYVASFRERVGLEYGMSEGATTLAAAFVFGSAFGAVRGGYRVHMGDVNVTHAIEMQDAMIKEMETRGPIQPTEASILHDMKISQELFKTFDQNMSVRDAYTEAARLIAKIDDSALTAATRASALADADLERVSQLGDGDDFTPDIDLDTPLDSKAITEEGIVEKAAADAIIPDGEEVVAPRTVGEAFDEIDTRYKAKDESIAKYVECMNG